MIDDLECKEVVNRKNTKIWVKLKKVLNTRLRNWNKCLIGNEETFQVLKEGADTSGKFIW